MSELTQGLLKELFDYRDGNLYRKKSSGGVKIGEIAGNLRSDGYQGIQINGKNYLGHRLIFLWYHGYLPKEIDHIDGNPTNNNITNLREATHQENCRNQKKHKSWNGKPTSSDYIGVTWNKQLKKWGSQIWIGGKMKHLGLFTSEIEAAKAYDKAAIKRSGKFARLNFDNTEQINQERIEWK